MRTDDLTDVEVEEFDDKVSSHLPTVKLAREVKRHRATMARIDQWARELVAGGSTTSMHFARVLRRKLAGE